MFSLFTSLSSVSDRMAGRVLVVALIASALNQRCTAEPKTQDIPCDTVQHESLASWGCSEKSKGGDSCSENKNLGAADALIKDLYLKLRDAELELANPNNYPRHYKLKNGEEFDFIVVGAGTAGAVVANRLSEVEEWRVLLVEAGGDPPITTEVPALTITLQGTDVDWQYKTDPVEDNCLGMVGNQCAWPRGKMLGGSSSINYMMHTRGHPRDFDGWAAAGNIGWSYEEVLPYFKKSEGLKDADVLAMEDAEIYHNTNGLLSLESWPNSEDFKEAIDVLEEGLKELGYPYNPDCNGKNHTGFTKMQAALKDRRRCSSAKAFLSPIKERENIFLSKHTLATKILIDRGTSKAYGINLTSKEGQKLEVRAKKEIILSAGSINTPQLLMLSGIGPKLHLSDLGIPVVKNLSVGENLQDHPLMMTFALTANFSFPITPPNVQDTFNFLFKQSSRLSSLGPLPFATYINTISGVNYPDIELLQVHIPKNNRQETILSTSMFNFRKSTIDEYIKINENGYTILTGISMMRPYSRGRVLLKSIDPNTHPRIIAGTLSDKRDVDTFLRAYDFILKLSETEAFKGVDVKFHEVKLPECEKNIFSSPEYRECAMRHLTATTYHYSGTCKMGPAGDPSAVVDPFLRVHGVGGLRVVDASVMPTIVSAHINAAVTMVGEKAADMIKQEWETI